MMVYYCSDLLARIWDQWKTSVWDVETWPCVISNLDLDPFVVMILGPNP